jgi:pSer/pThr/pTyr-binding forkhead associated (FHA) protein
MVQFRILSGKKAGAAYVARRFPVRIGRAADCELRVEEDGIWDRHAQVDFIPADGFVLAAQPNCLVAINSEPVQETVLRNGDVIEAGSLKLQFWLSETRQAGLRLRESLTWVGIGLVCLGQIALIYWLLR